MKVRLQYGNELSKSAEVSLKIITPHLRKSINEKLVAFRKGVYADALKNVDDITFAGEEMNIDFLLSLLDDSSKVLSSDIQSVMQERIEELNLNDTNILIARELCQESKIPELQEGLQTETDSEFWQNQSEEVLAEAASYFHRRIKKAK